MLRKIIKCSIYTLNQDYINKYGYCAHVEKYIYVYALSVYMEVYVPFTHQKKIMFYAHRRVISKREQKMCMIENKGINCNYLSGGKNTFMCHINIQVIYILIISINIRVVYEIGFKFEQICI